jgi:hypothetical protein
VLSFAYDTREVTIELAEEDEVIEEWTCAECVSTIHQQHLQKALDTKLSILLLTNFYAFAVFGDTTVLGIWGIIISVIFLPLVCLGITYSLMRYLKEYLDREIANGIVIGGTIGYMLSIALLIIFSSFHV